MGFANAILGKSGNAAPPPSQPGAGDWVGQVTAWLAQQQEQRARERQQQMEQLATNRATGGGPAPGGVGRGSLPGAGEIGGYGGFSGNPLSSSHGAELSGPQAANLFTRLSGAFGLPTMPGESRFLGSWLTPYDVYNRPGQSTGPSVQQYGMVQGAGPFGLPLLTPGGSGSQHDAGAIRGAADGQYGYSALNGFNTDEQGMWGLMNPDLGMDFSSTRGRFGNMGSVGASPYRGSASPWDWGYSDAARI